MVQSHRPRLRAIVARAREDFGAVLDRRRRRRAATLEDGLTQRPPDEWHGGATDTKHDHWARVSREPDDRARHLPPLRGATEGGTSVERVEARARRGVKKLIQPVKKS
jgi:hypothetical protein